MITFNLVKINVTFYFLSAVCSSSFFNILKYECHGRFSFELEALIIVALSYVLNPMGTSDLFEEKDKFGF